MERCSVLASPFLFPTKDTSNDDEKGQPANVVLPKSLEEIRVILSSAAQIYYHLYFGSGDEPDGLSLPFNRTGGLMKYVSNIRM